MSKWLKMFNHLPAVTFICKVSQLKFFQFIDIDDILYTSKSLWQLQNNPYYQNIDISLKKVIRILLWYNVSSCKINSVCSNHSVTWHCRLCSLEATERQVFKILFRRFNWKYFNQIINRLKESIAWWSVTRCWTAANEKIREYIRTTATGWFNAKAKKRIGIVDLVEKRIEPFLAEKTNFQVHNMWLLCKF